MTSRAKEFVAEIFAMGETDKLRAEVATLRRELRAARSIDIHQKARILELEARVIMLGGEP